MKIVITENTRGIQTRYKAKQVQTRGIFWKTTCNKWVKKIHGIKQGLSFTGEQQEFVTGSATVYVTLGAA